MSWSPEEFDRTMALVKKRSATDRAFRELALRDPGAAIRSIVARELPDDIALRFVESPGIHMVVLPDFVG